MPKALSDPIRRIPAAALRRSLMKKALYQAGARLAACLSVREHTAKAEKVPDVLHVTANLILSPEPALTALDNNSRNAAQPRVAVKAVCGAGADDILDPDTAGKRLGACADLRRGMALKIHMRYKILTAAARMKVNYAVSAANDTLLKMRRKALSRATVGISREFAVQIFSVGGYNVAAALDKPGIIYRVYKMQLTPDILRAKPLGKAAKSLDADILAAVYPGGDDDSLPRSGSVYHGFGIGKLRTRNAYKAPLLFIKIHLHYFISITELSSALV